MKPVLRHLGKEMKEALSGEGQYNTGIRRQKDPNGSDFALLRDSTIKIRNWRSVTHDRILQEKWAMVEKIKILALTNTMVAVGVNNSSLHRATTLNASEISAWHCMPHSDMVVFGRHVDLTKTPKGAIPPRMIYGFSEQLEEEVISTLDSYISFTAMNLYRI